MCELLPRGDGVGIAEAHGVFVVREWMFASLLGALLGWKPKKLGGGKLEASQCA